MAAEQFSLCWDNFHKNMSSGMHSMLESEDLVDVTLAVEGRYLKAHKMVLSVCSPYFRELFKSNPCQHPIVFMKDVSYIALRDLLQFMYQGEVQVNQENLGTFIKTAEALQIKGLTGDNNNTGELLDTESTDKSSGDLPLKRSADSEEIKTLTTRVKKTPGPASKKPRISAPPESNKADGAPTPTEVVHFKMEPYEGDSSVGQDNQEENSNPYLEEAVDDVNEEQEDYSLIEGNTDDPQAGTSTDGGADGQENAIEQVTVRRSHSNILTDGFVYHHNAISKKLNVRYLVCSEYKRLVCRARAVIPLNGNDEDLILTKPHNHPPILHAKDKETFMRTLKEYVYKLADCPLREIYQAVELLLPEGAEVCPFNKICTSMRRWRNSALNEISNSSSSDADVKIDD